MPSRIEDYALIGDCETAALVAKDGSIDWLCWPRFDSDACLAALLGTPEHGRFLVAPAEASVSVTRRYRQDTLILETHYETATGAVWVAFDRGVKIAEEFGLQGPVEEWRGIAGSIQAAVLAKGFDTELNSFVMAYGSKWLDASLLLIPTTGFISADDPKFVGTLRAIEGRMLQDGFVMRHDPAEKHTGLAHGEGAFLACSFWLVDAYQSVGRHGDALKLLGRLLALRNEVGLLAEEYDVSAARQVGNFPQAFSHIALINTVHNLSRPDKPAEQRSGESAAT